MSVRTTATLIVLGASMAIAAACDTCAKNMVVGTAKVLGNGLVWSWAKLDDKGVPTSIGITMTETALNGLPTAAEMPAGMEPTMEYILDLPASVKGKPFDHVGFHWNPVGHVPKGLYDTPHFDVHFYMVSPEQRTKITAVGEDLKLCQKQPDAKFIPTGYILPPDTIVPQMGAHWIDPKTPELNGHPFTTTFLYGTYNGEGVFWEPMVTKAFLESKPNFTEDIKMPTDFAKPGYYPARYTVQYNADRKEYTIAIAGLTGKGDLSQLATTKAAAK